MISYKLQVLYISMRSLFCFIKIIKVFTKGKFPMILCWIILRFSWASWRMCPPRLPSGEFIFYLSTPASDVFLQHLCKGQAMALRISVLWYNRFYVKTMITFLWEKTGPIRYCSDVMLHTHACIVYCTRVRSRVRSHVR